MEKGHTVTTSSPDVVVIGGGIMGTAIAWVLSQRGARVRLLERQELAREASLASAGIISPPSSRHGARVDLALRAYRRYPSWLDELAEQSGMSVGHVRTGEIDVAMEENLDDLRERFDWQERQDMQPEWLDDAELRRREPGVHPAFAAAIFNPHAGSVLLGQVAEAQARAASSLGAKIETFASVSSIIVKDGNATGVLVNGEFLPAGQVVVAAGAWSRLLANSLGTPIPTMPVRGQMLAIGHAPQPVRAIIAGGGGYIVPRADGTIAVGATEEHSAGFHTQVTPAGIAWLVDLLRSLAPTLADGVLVDTWAGLRPGTIDGEPIIGPIPGVNNVWAATGHFRSGALLAPSTAEVVADGLLSGVVDPSIAAFSAARFINVQ